MATLIQPDQLNALSHDHIKVIRIDNWRYIREDHSQEHRDIGRGTYVFCCGLYFIPGITAEDIMNASASDDEVIEAFFYKLHHGDPWCHRCHGSGKITWIDNARGGIARNRPGYRYDKHHEEYRRNPKCVMAYSRNSYYSLNKQLYLAPTLVDEGELMCRECKGTGLWLNATVHIFQGFPRIKSKIVYEVGDKYDIETMYKMLGQDCVRKSMPKSQET